MVVCIGLDGISRFGVIWMGFVELLGGMSWF